VDAAQLTLFEFVIGIGPSLVLVCAISFVSYLLMRLAISLTGFRVYVYLFGWLGSAVHELGHAFFCVLFCHKITKIKLFDPSFSNGCLGYVRHSYTPNLYTRIGSTFISIGPIVSGALVICIAGWMLVDLEFTHFLEPNPTPLTAPKNLFSFYTTLLIVGAGIVDQVLVPDLLTNWKFYIFLFVAVSVGSSMTLSKSDASGAFWGVCTIVFSLFGFNLATGFFLNSAGALTWIANGNRALIMVHSAMAIALTVNLLLTFLVLLGLLVRKGYRIVST
jgi:hypothetical protein